MPDVRRITIEVVQRAYRTPPKKIDATYYVRECGGRDSIRGLALRVLRTQVQIGTRYREKWHNRGVVPQDVTLQELEELRASVRDYIRQLEDEAIRPTLALRRSQSFQEVAEEQWTEYLAMRGDRSARTLEEYRRYRSQFLYPEFGKDRLVEISVERVSRFRDRIYQESGSVFLPNRALQQGHVIFEFARKRGRWEGSNPFDQALVSRYPEPKRREFLSEADLSAIGPVLREAEAIARSASSERSRSCLGLRTLGGIRLVLYTGARQREEICAARLDWCEELQGAVPRIMVPRAKGDRGDRHGRPIFLGPHAVQIIQDLPRPEGCPWILPGDRPGTHLFRLNEGFNELLSRAGVKRVQVKALRHTLATLAPLSGVYPQHVSQLLGHQGASGGAPTTDRVYLHLYGPALGDAARKYEDFVRTQLGDLRAVP